MNTKNLRLSIVATIAFLLVFNITAKADGGCRLTAAETAKEMGPGWNLGNTLEAGNGDSQLFTNKGGLGMETYWQGTKTTQKLIDFVKAQGFKSVRIPCAWVMGHISDASTYKIDEKWMARVKEIVDYCINDGLYVVLNDHWDGGWLENNIKATGDAKEKNKQVLAAIWKQIAEAFRDYDHHLLFAGLNEPNAEDQATTNNLMEYWQVFVDAVRATGGNNAERVLVVQGPSTNIEHTCKYVKKMPTDTAKDRLMIEVHYYNPWQFWGMEKDESWGNQFFYWGKDNHQPGSKHNPNWDCEESAMRKQLQMMDKQFAQKGYSVVLGEFGANWRNLSGMAGESQEKHNASIYLHYKLLYQYALELGMVPMAWDTNYCNYGMTILDRKNLKVYNTIMMDAITEAIRTTGIENVIIDNASKPCDNKVYDLQGRQIKPEAMQDGRLYIRGGKKVIVNM